MNSLYRIVSFVIVLLGSYLQIFAQVYPNFFPTTGQYEKQIVTYNYASVSQGHRLAAISLQGIVNRNNASILLKDQLCDDLFQLYINKGLIVEQKEYTNIYLFLKAYKDHFSGAVVFDPDKPFTINLATNIAGVENRIIISPDMVKRFKRYTGKTDVKDLRDFNFSDAYHAFTWYKDNIYPSQIKTCLAVANDSYMHDVYRDYLIEFKIPVFWLPGKDDSDYSEKYENSIKELLNETPENIPVLGFWPDANGNGYEEYEGVKLAGMYGKFTIVNTWVGNYSFLSAMGHNFTFKQVKARNKIFREFNPAKKYVALIMIESGDSPAYIQYGIWKRQWSDPVRGEVPISYGINPSMRMILPAFTQHLYETATENDFFFCSISGAGYCYPFEGYGQLTPNPGQTLKDYFKLTADNMALLDLDMLGLYTHPNTTKGMWTSNDLKTFINYIEPMDGLKSVISGMHRTGYTGTKSNACYTNNGKDVTVHHTLTFWPSTDYKWDDESQDAVAISFMENEIKTYGQDSHFIQAMFYSWMYGPRRLKKLQDKMMSEGYEFVTLNEFDYLYRISKGNVSAAE